MGFDQITCLAEVFQNGRFVDVDTHSPYITGMVTDTDLKLLDLMGTWFTRVGGTAALAAGDKRMTRKWAKALLAAYPDADGMIAPSAVVTGKEVLTLWVDKMPSAPTFTSPLNSPAIAGDIARLAYEIGFSSNIA